MDPDGKGWIIPVAVVIVGYTIYKTYTNYNDSVALNCSINTAVRDRARYDELLSRIGNLTQQEGRELMDLHSKRGANAIDAATKMGEVVKNGLSDVRGGVGAITSQSAAAGVRAGTRALGIAVGGEAGCTK
jgi:hypothetical protein